MYCLDTSVIVDIFRGDKAAAEEVSKLWSKDIYVASISVCELYKGAYGHVKSEDKIKIIDEFLGNVRIAPLNKESAEEFGKFWQELKKRGKMMNDFDMMIAAIAKSENLTIVTRDKHFKEFGVKVIVV